MTECSPRLTLSPLPRKLVVVTADGGAGHTDERLHTIQRT
jgi:hypothetical protein